MHRGKLVIYMKKQSIKYVVWLLMISVFELLNASTATVNINFMQQNFLPVEKHVNQVKIAHCNIFFTILFSDFWLIIHICSSMVGFCAITSTVNLLLRFWQWLTYCWLNYLQTAQSRVSLVQGNHHENCGHLGAMYMHICTCMQLL